MWAVLGRVWGALTGLPRCSWLGDDCRPGRLEECCHGLDHIWPVVAVDNRSVNPLDNLVSEVRCFAGRLVLPTGAASTRPWACSPRSPCPTPFEYAGCPPDVTVHEVDDAISNGCVTAVPNVRLRVGVHSRIAMIGYPHSQTSPPGSLVSERVPDDAIVQMRTCRFEASDVESSREPVLDSQRVGLVQLAHRDHPQSLSDARRPLSEVSSKVEWDTSRPNLVGTIESTTQSFQGG